MSSTGIVQNFAWDCCICLERVFKAKTAKRKESFFLFFFFGHWDVNHLFPVEIAGTTYEGAVGTSLSEHRICKAGDNLNYFLSKVLLISNKHYNFISFFFLIKGSVRIDIYP